MSRKVAALLATAGMTAVMVALAGVALAAVIACTGGRCEGTNEPDQITGTDQRDRIFGLAGADSVEARTGEDELNGGNGPDKLFGGDDSDTYFGGRGEDQLSELSVQGGIETGDDVMNGGPNRDVIDGGEGDDILRGQKGSEHAPGDPRCTIMFGDPGDDQLFGGPGEDAMEGEEGTDEHYGGENGDFIDAADEETPRTDAPDLVDCGGGFDTARVLSNDIVLENCEEVIDALPPIAQAGADPAGTSEEEQRRQREAFLAGR